jgi:hypothetical protein
MQRILILRRPPPLFVVPLPLAAPRRAVARELEQFVAKIAGSVDTPKRKICRLPR